MSTVSTIRKGDGANTLAILRVLIWELFRRLEFSYLMILLGGFLLPWAVFRGVLNVPVDEFNSVHYFPPFFAMNASLVGIAAFQAQRGVRQWLGTRPVSSWFILLTLTLCSVGIVLATYLVTHVLVGRIYGVDWPWLRPVLWLVSFVVLARCTYFRIVVGRQWEILAAGGIFLLVLWAFVIAQSPGDGGALVLDTPFTAVELVSLVLGNGLALFVGYRSLCADRTSGLGCLDASVAQTSLISASLNVDQVAPNSAVSNRLPTLSGKADAIQWMARRQFEVPMFWVALLTGVLFAGFAFCTIVEKFELPLKLSRTGRLFEGALSLLMLVCIGMGIGVGSLLGSLIRTPSEKMTSMMSAFHAVRPISTRDFWNEISKALFRFSVITWATLCVVNSVLPCVVAFREWQEDKAAAAKGVILSWKVVGDGFFEGLQQNAFYPTFGMASVLVWLLLTFFVVWTLARFWTSVMVFGNDRAISIGIGTLCGLFVLMCFVGLAVAPETAEMLADAAWMLGGSVAVVVTAWCFRVAWRRQLIGGMDVVWGCGCWAVAALLIYPQFVSTYRGTGAAMLCVLAAFSFAAGPLGIAAARQR